MLFGADAAQDSYWQLQFLGQWSSRLGGGTEQVQRNVAKGWYEDFLAPVERYLETLES